jgi:hypothetical protein
MINLLRALVYRVFGDAPDKAWKPTGLRFMTERTYDQAAAVRGARAARKRSETGKLLHKPRPKPGAKVLPMGERKQAR